MIATYFTFFGFLKELFYPSSFNDSSNVAIIPTIVVRKMAIVAPKIIDANIPKNILDSNSAIIVKHKEDALPIDVHSIPDVMFLLLSYSSSISITSKLA